jgi:hypothetical protein
MIELGPIRAQARRGGMIGGKSSMKIGLFLGIALALPAWAANPVPNVFIPGNPARAAEVNANFQALVDQLATLEGRVQALGDQLSTVARQAQTRLEAESAVLSASVQTGAVQADTTASGGKARYGSGSGTTGPAGRLFGMTAVESGAKLASGLTRVAFRLKVTNNSSSDVLANINCTAKRAGSSTWTSLASINVKASDFSSNLAWATYTLVCDWQPDDADQFIGIDNFILGTTDLWVDYLQFQPVVESQASLVTLLGPNLGDQRNNTTMSTYGTWYTIPGRTLNFVKRYPASKLKVTYQDTLGSAANVYQACEWQILLDGAQIAFFSAADLDRPSVVWMMENAAHVAWATANAGSHSITIQNRGSNRASAWAAASGNIVNECLMGWHTSSNFVSVEEIP